MNSEEFVKVDQHKMEMWKGSLQPAVSHQQATQQEKKRYVPWIHAESHHWKGAIEEILAVTTKRLIKDSILMLSHLVRGRIIEMITLKSFIVANQSVV